MNGFANAVLTLLLGWLRSLLNTIWSLLGSEGGGELINLLREHWKLLFLVLCVGGFVVDRIIYLIRWRPYYVWSSRRHHHSQDDAREPSVESYPYNNRTAYAPPPRYAAPEDDEEPVDAYTEATMRYRRPTQADALPAAFAPTSHGPDASRAMPEMNPQAYMEVPSPFSRPAATSGAGYNNRTSRAFAQHDSTADRQVPETFRPSIPGAFAPAVRSQGSSSARGDPGIPDTFRPSAAGNAVSQRSSSVQMPAGNAFAPQRQSVSPPSLQDSRRRRAAVPAFPAQSEASYAPRQQRRDTSVAFTPDASFAPTASYVPLPNGILFDAEPIPDELRYDDDPINWQTPPSTVDIYAPRTPQDGHKRQDQYLEDVRSGFAPQPTPEQLYAKRPDPSVSEPIHPGLDLETFQQNIGLTSSQTLDVVDRQSPEEAYPSFTPFPVAEHAEPAALKTRGLGALAKKARSFVNGEDERNPLSIRDLQATVDMKSAFHAPVYPKKKPEGEEE